MSITDTIDALTALRTYLLSSAYVTDQVGVTGVYIGQIPRGTTNPGKAIVLLQNTGEANIWLPLFDADIQFRSYGTTSVEAREVYRGLRSALHGAKRQKIDPGVDVGTGTNWMLTAYESGGPSDESEPEIVGWHFVLSVFRCLFVSFPVE